ncbi:MAG: hypothetical protein JXD23_16395 [Spirochaetales bacterium]|nr:hypothetical protein [Spirochaetales bacterium]
MDKSPVKFIRAGAFGLVLVFFFLPFVVVSCPNTDKAVSVTGIQLSTGTVIRGATFGPNVENRRIPLHWQALAALLCAVAGIVVSFLPKKPSFFACLIAGAGGILFMILLRTRIAAEGAEWVNQGFRLTYASGFWTTITLFCIAVVVTLVFNPYIKWKFPAPRKRTTRRRR